MKKMIRVFTFQISGRTKYTQSRETTFQSHSPKTLKDQGYPWAIKNLGEKLWVSVLLSLALKSCEDNDILVLVSDNSTEIITDPRRFVGHVMPHTDFFCLPCDCVGNYCGQETLNHLVPESSLRREILFAPLLKTQVIIAKTTQNLRKFSETFLSVVGNGIKNTGHPSFTFRGHAGVDAVFSVLAYREGLLPINWRESWMRHWKNSSIYTVPRTSTEGKIWESSVVNIFGKPVGKWSSAIVIQGIYKKDVTENCNRIFLERNKGSLIIVSTYIPQDETTGEKRYGEFLSTFEKTILTDENHPDHGRLVYILSRSPSRKDYPDFYRTNFMNQNFQRLSSFVGLLYAKLLDIPLSLKIRSDAFLGKADVCQYLFQNYIKDLPILPKFGDTPRVEGRIVTTNHTIDPFQYRERHREYLICDQVLFGYTKDLLGFFDMFPGTCWDDGRGINIDKFPEIHLMECWMKDQNIDQSVDGIAEISARYMSICGMVEIEYLNQKFSSYEKYMKCGKRYLEQVFVNYERIFKYFKTPDWLRWIEIIKERDKDSRCCPGTVLRSENSAHL